MFSGLFDYYGGGYHNEYGHGSLWLGFAEKSKHASEREERAKAAFDKFAAHAKTNQPIHDTLLDPSCHLTGPCFRDFKKHVKTRPGWDAKQRRATEQEKAQYRPTGRGHANWTDITYKPPTVAAAKPTSAIKKKPTKAK